MSLLSLIVLFGLLQRLCHGQDDFTVELTEAAITGFEGDMVAITVRLQGQINGQVDVELLLLTESQFRNTEEGNGFRVSSDPAESTDFSPNTPLSHTFSSVSTLNQMYTFNIDIYDDDMNELEEEFVALVDVTRIQNQEQDIFNPDDSNRLYSTITIGIDPNYPDKTLLSISTPDAENRVLEGTMGWPITLTIASFWPEDEIEVTITAQPTSSTPAMPSSDYNLLVTSVTLMSGMTNYSVTMDLVEDNIPEAELEQVEVTVSGSNRITFIDAASIAVSIEDNDDLLIGFTESQLVIKEGGTGEATVAILNADEVAVSVEGLVKLEQRGNSKPEELPSQEEITLSQANRRQSFSISIDNDDVIESSPNHERTFSLEIVVISADTNRRSVSPKTLRVIIKDNDTDVEFGLTGDVVTQRVKEGGEFTITVGFLGNVASLTLDDDFVVGYSVKFLDAGDDLETTDIPDGVLKSDVTSNTITIKTKSNDEVQEDRQFEVSLQHTSVDFNSPLVKLRTSTLSVIVEDDDVHEPNKPTVRVDPLPNSEEFQISWNTTMSQKSPVNGYRVEIELPNGKVITKPVTDPKITSLTNPYIIDGVEYTTANISVRVCAINQEGEACSAKIYHSGLQQGGSSESSDGGLSGGEIAAIVIVLLLLVIIVIVLLLVFYCFYNWSTYYPIVREKKYEEAFADTREEFRDDV